MSDEPTERDCTCGYGGFHEPENTRCALFDPAKALAGERSAERDVETLQTAMLGSKAVGAMLTSRKAALAILASDWYALARREAMIDFATWLSEQEAVDAFTPDEAVDQYLLGDDATTTGSG